MRRSRPNQATIRSRTCCRASYKLAATLQGFQQTIVPEIVVEVNKSNSVDVKLGVGQVSEAVEVTGSAAVALQHNDSTVTNTMSEQTVLRLPNPTRSIESIQFNQPLDDSRTPAASTAAAPVPARSQARAPTRTPTRSTAPTCPTTSSATASSRRCRRRSCRCPPRASRSSARPRRMPTPRSAAAAARSSSSSPSAAPTGSADPATSTGRTTSSTPTPGTAIVSSQAEAGARGQPRRLLARRSDPVEQDVLLHQLRSAPLPAHDGREPHRADRHR